MVIRSMSQISDANQAVKLDLVSWRVAAAHFVACTAVELSGFHLEAQDSKVEKESLKMIVTLGPQESSKKFEKRTNGPLSKFLS